MRVCFIYDGGTRQMDTIMPGAPRVGEYVDMDDGYRRYVKSVRWAPKVHQNECQCFVMLEVGVAP